jgi:hypothetical protein
MYKAIAALMLTATPALADCPNNLDLFMRCTIEGGQKELQVCFDGNHANYRYGPIDGVPELELDRWISEGATYRPWKGVGRSIVIGMDVENGLFTYATYVGFDRTDAVENPAASMFGGVEVFEGDVLLTRLSCIPLTVDWVGY